MQLTFRWLFLPIIFLPLNVPPAIKLGSLLWNSAVTKQVYIYFIITHIISIYLSINTNKRLLWIHFSAKYIPNAQRTRVHTPSFMVNMPIRYCNHRSIRVPRYRSSGNLWCSRRKVWVWHQFGRDSYCVNFVFPYRIVIWID